MLILVLSLLNIKANKETKLTNRFIILIKAQQYITLFLNLRNIMIDKKF